MTTEAQILAILTGQKVFDGRQWRVYDALGAELVDTGGVLWRGVHGALLWNAALQRAPAIGGNLAPSHSARAHRIRIQNQALIAAITAMAGAGAFS